MSNPSFEVINADCLDAMRAMPDNSVDAVVTDPPYFWVKREAWDRAWDSRDEFISWVGELCEQWQRILRPNGSLYLFASPKMAARVEVEVGRRFNVLNRICWRKHAGADNGRWSYANKESLRRFFEQKEEIIFAEHFGADNIAKGASGYLAKCEELRGFVFEPLRAYLDGEWQRAGLSRKDAEKATGTQMAGHWFTRSQWALPTEKHYKVLQKVANASGGEYLRREYEYLRREYEDLRREYEDLRREYEDLRRPFNVTPDVPYTDVWDFKTVPASKNKHVCEKPVALIEHIIRSSTKPGAIVLDCFAGSGATGEAALQLGREFIGIEKDPVWANRCAARLVALQHIGSQTDIENSGLIGK